MKFEVYPSNKANQLTIHWDQ